jgi:hypothetical protein
MSEREGVTTCEGVTQCEIQILMVNTRALMNACAHTHTLLGPISESMVAKETEHNFPLL